MDNNINGMGGRTMTFPSKLSKFDNLLKFSNTEILLSNYVNAISNH